MTVTSKPVRGPVTVRVRLEFSPFGANGAQLTPGQLEKLRLDLLTDLNAPRRVTSRGEQVNVEVEVRTRSGGQSPTPGYHQVQLFDGRTQSPPAPNASSYSPRLGPNVPGSQAPSFWNVANPTGFPHEVGNLMGLGDRFTQVYNAGGRSTPITPGVDTGDPADLARWARQQGLPAGGKVVTKGTRGTGGCDLMGPGFASPCAQMSKRDLDFLASRAGVSVTAEPGDVLLNRNGAHQNVGVGFRTQVIAPPGGTQTAQGVGAVCISQDKSTPEQGDRFDVLGPAASRTEPGMAELAKVLQAGSRTWKVLTPAYSDHPPELEYAVWAVTNQRDPDTTLLPAQTRALLSAAGVSVRPMFDFPQSGSPATGTGPSVAVNIDGVAPTIPTPPPTPPPPANQLFSAQLFPSAVRAGRRTPVRLAVSLIGPRIRLVAVLQRRTGSRWRAQGKATSVPVTGDALLRLTIPPLVTGDYRLLVQAGAGGSIPVPFSATR